MATKNLTRSETEDEKWERVAHIVEGMSLVLL